MGFIVWIGLWRVNNQLKRNFNYLLYMKFSTSRNKNELHINILISIYIVLLLFENIKKYIEQ